MKGENISLFLIMLYLVPIPLNLFTNTLLNITVSVNCNLTKQNIIMITRNNKFIFKHKIVHVKMED